MEWKSYGEHGRTAKGTAGTWRIVTNGACWILTVQPSFTRGMLGRGKFDTRQAAEAHAEAEDDGGLRLEPLQFGLSGGEVE